MSRKQFAVCLGLLLSGCCASSAIAQETNGFSYESGVVNNGQTPVFAQQPQQYYQPYQPSQQPNYQQAGYQQNNSPAPIYQPVYQQNGDHPSPPMHQAGFHRHAMQGQPHQVHNRYCDEGACQQEPSAFWTSFYRNTRWPMPFRAQDVSSVTTYFDIQRENGWRLHNTVGSGMFDQQSNCLTQAGKNHVQSILRDNPSDRKAVFVLQGRTQQQTAARVQSTELAISEMIPVGDLPPVYITDRDAPGSSGAYQASVMAQMKASIPIPRLTSSNQASGSSSGTP
jgi:hypothetical protein